MREHVPEERAEATPVVRAAPAPPVPRILALQRSAGNRAVSAMLSRQAPPAAPAADTVAAAEASARESFALIRDSYKQMLLSPETKIRNTALMMDEPGRPPGDKRVRATPMTKRSDSADLNLKHGTDASKKAYYFYGTKQDNEQEDDLDTLGTIEGDGTIVIRGKDPTSGNLRSHEDIVGTLVHETSHIIVKDYGEHAKTATDAGSFDRYKDEFRAYFIEPHSSFSGMGEDARADAIREHLCGKEKGKGSYSDLDKAFWAEPHDTNQFRQDVLAHKRPDGFNLDNSPYLDRLVHLLRAQKEGKVTVEESLFQVSVLSPAERAEAAGSTLIPKLLAGLPAAEAERIKKALNSPASVHFGKEINPNSSPRVTAFLEAVTARVPEQITETYKACNPQDRADLTANAHFISWLGRVLPDQIVMRTIIKCMVEGRSFVFFERVRVFLLACTDAAGATEMPDELRKALKALTFEVRIAYYGLCKDDYDTRVQPLQPAVRSQVAAILRGDAEP
jgi:hypothetical protein